MFLAMNRFKIKVGNEKLFEKIWMERDSHLEEVPGFLEFSLMRGDSNDEFTLFASHTIWSSRDDFSNWTKSEAFNDWYESEDYNKIKPIRLNNSKGEVHLLDEANLSF